MTTAVPTMPRKKESMQLEGVKIDRDLLNKARIVFTWIKSQMKDAANFTLAQYISQCLREERSLLKDYAKYINEEAKRLSK